MVRAKKDPEEKMELGHEPIPIYRTIFHIVITLSVIYLILIFWLTK